MKWAVAAAIAVRCFGIEERARRDDEDAHSPSAPEIPKRGDVPHREHQTEARLRHTMKWENVDMGPGYYYISAVLRARESDGLDLEHLML